MKIRSFKLKLIFSYVAVILVSIGCIFLVLDRSLEEHSLRNIQVSLMTEARLIARQLSPEILKKRDVVLSESWLRDLSQATSSRVTLIDKQGRVVVDTQRRGEEILGMENHLNRPEVRTALSGGEGADTRYSSTLNIDMLYVALPLKDKEDIWGVLRLALPLRGVEKTLFVIRKIILLGLLFAFGLAFILGILVVEDTVRPVRRMTEVARKYAGGDFSRRIIELPQDEIGELGNTLNKMAQEIEDRIKMVRAQDQRLVAIFNSMIEGVVVVDKAGRIVSVNPAIERIFGVRRDDVEGKVFLEAVRNSDMAEIIRLALQEGAAVTREITLFYPVQKFFEVNATPIVDDKVTSGCLVVLHDMTEIRRLETVRSDFVANVSHELKTPLTSIKGFVETLLDGALNDEKNNRSFLKIIQEHAERLDGLLDDLLALSHLESGEMTLNKKQIDIGRQFEEVLAGFRVQLKKKSIEVKNDLGAGVFITADKNRIQQVLTNLIDNAIKFNKEKGSIHVSARESEGGVKVLIEDSGSGIPPKDIPRIFERFYRVDKARSRELGGTGLGLSIVKHIVELHGGRVGVESTEGLGSTFWFILPK